jgi:hypothetical protein
MYRPVATPFRATADTITAARTGSECGGATAARTTSMTAPISTTLHSVPRPGRCRIGIHSSSTAAPTMIAQVPVARPVRRASPWCRTSHGSTPSPASSSIESLIPYSTSPANSWIRRRGMPPRWQNWPPTDRASSPGFGFYLAERAVVTADVHAAGPAGAAAWQGRHLAGPPPGRAAAWQGRRLAGPPPGRAAAGAMRS